MTTEQLQVKEWMTTFGQETPVKPTLPDMETRKLRAKLIMEEALETIEAMGVTVSHLGITTDDYESDAIDLDIKSLEFYPRNLEHLTPKEELEVLADIADGCEDSKVVNEGTLIACGLVKAGNLDEYTGRDILFEEVMRSNFSKMWTEEERNEAQLEQGVDSKWTYRIYQDPHSNRNYIMRDETGKVIKSPSYSPPNLKPIIEEMMK